MSGINHSIETEQLFRKILQSNATRGASFFLRDSDFLEPDLESGSTELPQYPIILSKQPDTPQNLISAENRFVFSAPSIAVLFRTQLMNLSSIKHPGTNTSGYTAQDIYPAEAYLEWIRSSLTPEELNYFIRNHLHFNGSLNVYKIKLKNDVLNFKSSTYSNSRITRAKKTAALLFLSKEGLFFGITLLLSFGLLFSGFAYTMAFFSFPLRSSFVDHPVFKAIQSQSEARWLPGRGWLRFYPICSALFDQGTIHPKVLQVLFNIDFNGQKPLWLSISQLPISLTEGAPYLPSFSISMGFLRKFLRVYTPIIGPLIYLIPCLALIGFKWAQERQEKILLNYVPGMYALTLVIFFLTQLTYLRLDSTVAAAYACSSSLGSKNPYGPAEYFALSDYLGLSRALLLKRAVPLLLSGLACAGLFLYSVKKLSYFFHSELTRLRPQPLPLPFFNFATQQMTEPVRVSENSATTPLLREEEPS